MNLKQAQKLGMQKQFAKEHEIPDPRPDGEQRFHKLIELMTGSPSASVETSGQGASSSYAGTQTRQGKKKDVS